MGVILEELIKQIDSRNIKNIAGSKGISNMVEWAHMVDNVEIAGFLNGGEIAFTTGIGIKDEMTLLDLVTAVYKQSASGMVINVGPYIEKIGQEVIDFGNEKDFPIFEVPWRVHMSDIMRMFCLTITRSEQKAMELSAAFKNAIFTPQMKELYMPVLMQKGYFSEWDYTAALINICDRVEKDDYSYGYTPVLTERLDILHKKIEKKIREVKYDAVIYYNQEKLLIILSDTSEKEAYSIIKNVCQQITGSLKGKEVFFASVGKTAGQLSKLCDSYMAASRIEQLIRLDGLENEIKSYSQMGIGRMLLNLKHMDSLDEYYADTIQPLDEYDEANGGNLVETLECYMQHNGSVQDTAEEMYVHRNTVNYKLKKIEAILGVNLTEFDVRNQLMTGMLVKKIRRLK